MKRVILVLALVILGCTSSKITNTPARGPDGTIRGLVVNAGQPLPGATVILHTPRGDFARITDTKGAYEFFNVAPGVYRLEARLEGMKRHVSVITVRGGVAAGLTVALKPATMEAVTVVAADGPLLTSSVISTTVTKSPQVGSFDYDGGWLGSGKQQAPVQAAQAPIQTAFYSPIAESEYVDAQKQATTTFSIDVDGAAYANVRRFLRFNLVPPPDAVRIEEMVNYFTYRYPQPADGRPVAISTEVAGCP